MPWCCSAASFPVVVWVVLAQPKVAWLCRAHSACGGHSHPCRASVPCHQTETGALFYLREVKRMSCRLPGTWSLGCSHEDQTGTELLQQEFEKKLPCGNSWEYDPNVSWLLMPSASQQAKLAIQIKAGPKVPSILSSKLLNPRENLLQHLWKGVGLDSTSESKHSSVRPCTGENSFPWAWAEWVYIYFNIPNTCT